MKKLTLFTLFVSVLATFGATTAMAGKQSICHFPPGNPDNFQTIVVSDNAVDKHVEKHSDLIGSCLANCETICDDGDACTQDIVPDPDQCYCQAEPTPVDCDDSNDCTADSCDSDIGACLNNPEILNGESCDDANPDTDGETCSDGVCEPDVVEEPCPCWTAEEIAIIDGVGHNGDGTWELVCFTDATYKNTMFEIGPASYGTNRAEVLGRPGRTSCIWGSGGTPGIELSVEAGTLTEEEWFACDAQVTAAKAEYIGSKECDS